MLTLFFDFARRFARNRAALVGLFLVLVVDRCCYRRAMVVSCATRFVLSGGRRSGPSCRRVIRSARIRSGS